VRSPRRTPGFRTRAITLATPPLDPAVDSVPDLAERYRRRWQVETALGQLKTTMRMDVRHGTTVPGVLQEFMVFPMVYHLVRLVTGRSATLQHRAVEQISFPDALRWLSAPHTGMPLVALSVHPTRPHRVEPRVKKRRPKPFPLMITPRQGLRRRLIQPALSG
jgi:Transposase DDE domain